MTTPTTLPASFAVGSVLTASQMNDLRGAFRVLQIVSATSSTLATNGTTTYADSGLTANITLSSNTNKVLILVNQSCSVDSGPSDLNVRLVKNSTTLQTQAAVINSNAGTYVVHYLDSPATTSALTYKIQFARATGSGNVNMNINSNPANMILCEISA
jgi:hypothetical protein